MKKKLSVLATFIIILTSCSKSKIVELSSNSGSTGTITEAGYGTSDRPFTAVAWQLPAGIQMEDSIHEYSYCWAFDPYTQVPPKDWKGVPLGFSFCLTLKNNTTHPITIEFPPQLAFSSSSAIHQNILTIELGTVEIDAGSMKTIVTQGFCLNLGREIPQPFDQATGNFLGYSFGPSTIPHPLLEVVDIIRSKHITMNDILKSDGTIDNTKAAKYAVIQAAIWEVTDRQGLTNDTKNQLLAL